MRNVQTVKTLVCGQARSWALVAGVALMSLGCNRGTDRMALGGAVTMAGQPVDRGSIEFAPLTIGQSSASGAVIAAGRYGVPRENGLVPGKYRVRIYWPERARAKQGPSVPVPKERIPAKYNVDSQLTVEVRPDGANAFDFAL